MADPISWVMIGGAAISAVGAVSQANAQQSASLYNTRLAERNATLALNQGNEDAARFRRRAEQSLGSLIAGYGAADVATDTGSPLDVLRMSVANAKLDEGSLRYRAILKSMGYHDEATLNRLAGKTAEEQGNLNAASLLLTGAGRTAATYQAGRRPLRAASSGQSLDITSENS